MDELKKLEQEIDTIVNDFRKTCFIVKDNGLDKDKSIELMALGMVNTKNTLLRLIETYTTRKELEARIDELGHVDGYECYWTQIKDTPDMKTDIDIEDRINQLSTQLSNQKKEQL